MKKILLYLAAILISVNAWANPTATSSTEMSAQPPVTRTAPANTSEYRPVLEKINPPVISEILNPLIAQFIAFIHDPQNSPFGGFPGSAGDRVQKILDNLKAEGFTGLDSVSSLNKAVRNGEFPPVPLDLKTLRFLSASDFTLNYHLEWLAYFAGSPDPWRYSGIDFHSDQINKRVVTLLTVLYPNHIITVAEHSNFEGNFKFDGTTFHWISSNGNFSTLNPIE